MKEKLAIIVPYRDRAEHLEEFSRYISNFLEGNDFKIFVIEQEKGSPFNRGKLFNVGFSIASALGYDLFCFHDVDLLPDHGVDYFNITKPTHLSKFVSQFDYEVPYEDIFGGVTCFTKEDFEKVNGFCNEYWGWGAEDDDLRERCKENGLSIERREGIYTSLHHVPNYNTRETFENNNTLKFHNRESLRNSGLSDLVWTMREDGEFKGERHKEYNLYRVDLKYSPSEPTFNFYTTSFGTDVQKVSAECIKKFYPQSKHCFINGKESLYPYTWYNWLEIAKIEEPDYAIHIDEDCFVVDPNVVKNLITKMCIEGIDIMGCRDGGNIMRRQNPYAINPFFMIVSKKAYLSFDFEEYQRSGSRLFSDDLIYGGETIESMNLKYDFSIDYEHNFEGYYHFFWQARENNLKFQFLEYEEEPYLNCSFLQNYIIHAWYLRARNSYQVFDRMNFSNKERYDKILELIKQQL